MKVTVFDYSTILKLINEFVAKHGIETVLQYKEDLKLDERINDLNTRFTWDIFWALPKNQRNLWLESIKQYGCVDTHIDTAIKKALSEVINKEVNCLEYKKQNKKIIFNATVLHSVKI